MKKFPFRGISFILCFLSLAFFLAQSEAQPKLIHLSLAESESKNHSAINIIWNSDQYKGSQTIVYGRSSGLKKSVKASDLKFDSTTVFKATLKKLKPGARYYYKCGSDETGWSDTFSFVTAPVKGKSRSFTVGVFGDTQNNEFNEQFQKTEEVIRQLSNFHPDFTLHMGDIVNNGSINADWQSFLSISQPLNAKTPIMPALGNHDVENKIGPDFQKPFPSFYSLFTLPGNGLDYSFDYENTHFVCIFSGIANTASEKGLLRFRNDSEEKTWLENDLSSARSNPKTEWIIVYMHYPLFSFGWSNVKVWKETLSPVLEKYGVDLCLAGHRHVYERHYPLNNGQPVNNGKGTVYITNGTAGGSPQGIGGSELPTMVFTSKEKMYNYAVMTIDGKSLKYEVFNLDREKIDEFEILKNTELWQKRH